MAELGPPAAVIMAGHELERCPVRDVELVPSGQACVF